MGKKAKTKSGREKASSRKVDKAALPPPPAPVTEEVSYQVTDAENDVTRRIGIFPVFIFSDSPNKIYCT
jgi:hypothetical protein